MTSSMYHLSLDLQNFNCLIIGLGKVGTRKLITLLKCNPKLIKIIDIKPKNTLNSNIQDLINKDNVIYENRAWNSNDIKESSLIFATTNNFEENTKITEICKKYDKLCNTATNPKQGSFQVPALAQNGPVTIAISTKGNSPHLAKKWRIELEEWLKPRVILANLLGKLRPLLLSYDNDSIKHAKIFKEISDSDLQNLLINRDFSKCKDLLQEKLPKSLHKHIAEVLNDLP